MSSAPPSVIPVALQQLMASLPIPKQQTKTFFSIQSRGHWENSVSDLLRFFMQPTEEHNFQGMFLETFLSLAKPDEWKDLDLSRVQIRREISTACGRMDLFIEGSNWLLIVENKIWAPLLNPLEDYERHAALRYPNKKPFFVILSPDENEGATGRWQHFSYRRYLDKLKPSLALLSSTSKWSVLAHEFVLHLEQLLYPQMMTIEPAEAQCIEPHLVEMKKIRDKLDAYNYSVEQALLKHLRELLPNHGFFVSQHTWATLIGSAHPERLWTFMLQTPTETSGNPSGQFRVGAWLAKELTPAETATMHEKLSGFQTGWDNGQTWADELFSTSAEAIARIGAVATVLAKIQGGK